MLKKPKSKPRSPDRDAKHPPKIQATWAVWDRLDALATKFDMSLAQTINSLIDFYEAKK